MNEVGEKLKEARKAKGYTLDDLQQMTKIQKRYLIAVEEGNLDVLPGKFYARAFIKQYADTVGLNGEELLKEHTEYIPEAKDEEYTQKVKSTQTRSKAKQGGFIQTVQESLPTILIVLLVLAIMVAIYLAWTQNAGPADDGNNSMINDGGTEEVEVDNNEDAEDPDQTEEPVEDENEQEDTEEEPDEEEEPEAEQAVELDNTTGNSTTFTVSGTHPDEQTIALIAEGGDTWVSITIDGSMVDQALLADGETLQASFGSDVSQIDLVVGNATVTAVELNGENVNFPEEAAGAVRQDLHFNFE